MINESIPQNGETGRADMEKQDRKRCRNGNVADSIWPLVGLFLASRLRQDSFAIRTLLPQAWKVANHHRREPTTI